MVAAWFAREGIIRKKEYFVPHYDNVRAVLFWILIILF